MLTLKSSLFPIEIIVDCCYNGNQSFFFKLKSKRKFYIKSNKRHLKSNFVIDN